MVSPLIAAAGITALGSIGSSLLGANASSNAAATNAQIAGLNYTQAERERMQALFWAIQNQLRTDQGTTDIYGNRTQYIPGAGVVTTPAPDVEKLIQATLVEQFRQQAEDATRVRELRGENFDRAQTAGLEADTLLQQYLRLMPGNENAIREMYDAETSRNVNQSFDRGQDSALMQAFRRGYSGDAIGDVVDRVATNRSDALNRATVGNRMQARGEKDITGQKGNITNLYNAFASRAAGVPTGAPAPSTVGARDGSAALTNAMMGANANVINAAGRPGGRMDYLSPDFSSAVGFGGVAEGLGSFLYALGSNTGTSDLQKLFLSDAAASGAGLAGQKALQGRTLNIDRTPGSFFGV